MKYKVGIIYGRFYWHYRKYYLRWFKFDYYNVIDSFPLNNHEWKAKILIIGPIHYEWCFKQLY